LNANKLSVALNLSRPEGVAVARRLALWADAVAENFAPGAMAKWGLDYASLVKERPDLLMISTCLNGQTGPERHYPGFGGQGSALLHRRRTGQGQGIDLAQVEGGIVCLSESMITYAANGEILGRMGNRSRHEAPHGVFPCAGKDRWEAIVVHDDEDWRRLVRAMGEPAWATDAGLATTAGRLARADEV